MKKAIIIVGILIVLIIIGIGIYMQNNRQDDRNYKEKILEASKNTDNLIITIKDNESETEINLTNSQFENMKALNPNSQITEEKFIEATIFAEEAKKRGIELTDEEVKEIESEASSEEILAGIDKEEEKNSITNALYDYLMRSTYAHKLRMQIIDEIDKGELILQDEELNKKLEEYKNDQKYAEKLVDADDNAKMKQLKKMSKKIDELKELYYDKIKEKYTVIKY